MLIALLILTALSMGLSAAALVMALLVWSGERRTGSAPASAAEEEKKSRPLDDERMREGIANLLAFEVGGGRGDE